MHSTAGTAVIPAIDKILAAFGTPETLMSDNGPPFNSAEFSKFARKLGFQHRKITPLAPWVNGTAERFMKNLAKVIQISQVEKKNWRHELTKYLRAYRATPHSMTGATPAELMFNGRCYGTNLPKVNLNPEGTKEQQEARDVDQRNKLKMKHSADKPMYVKKSPIGVGDKVLLKQKKLNKLSTAYEAEPYIVDEVRGSQVMASNHIHSVTRHLNLFKRVSGPMVQQIQDPTSSTAATQQVVSLASSPELTIQEEEEDLTQPLDTAEGTVTTGTGTSYQDEMEEVPPEVDTTDLGPQEPSLHPEGQSRLPSETAPQQFTEPETPGQSTSVEPPPRRSARQQRAGKQAPLRLRDPCWDLSR